MKSVFALALVLTATPLLAPGQAWAEATLVLDPEVGTEPDRLERFRRARGAASEVRVSTHPADAELELLYVRDRETRIHERIAAPARLLLPSVRSDDVVLVRAHRRGYRVRELAFPADRLPETLAIPLDPLPNALVAASHVELLGRNLLLLWTQAPADVRIQESSSSVHVVLAETRLDLPVPSDLTIDAIGEDLFVGVELAPGWQERTELRAHQARDPARGLERIVVEWVPRDGGLAATQRARAAFAALGPRAVDGCARSFEDRLREVTPASSLARGLAPTGRFVDAIHRAALRRLGELAADGLVELSDGTRFDPVRPIEADFVMGRVADARGYLALFAAFVRNVTAETDGDRVLAALIAPDLPASEVTAAIASARRAEASCRAAAP